MQKLAAVVLKVLLAAMFLALVPRVGAETPDDQYLKIYNLIQQGDALGPGHSSEASAKYREAQTALLQFQSAHPDWNPQVVAFRLSDLALKFGSEPPAAARGTPSPTVGGLFPKTRPAPKVFVVDCQNDFVDARMAAWTLQGLVNRSSAEIYVIEKEKPRHLEQLKDCGKPFAMLEQPPGANSGWRALFQKYQGHVKKLFVYDLNKDWTCYLALMAGAQQDGIPVTEPLKRDLMSEFGWKGDVEDFRDRWVNRIQAYDWALINLMPNCTKQVVFPTRIDKYNSTFDYAVASKGFAFWLDFHGERAEVQKIFRTRGYGVGTAMMGYANTGDDANEVANPFGFGYVASELYANGSFWSSFPNKTYSQSRGKAIKAEPGKIYASITWSDGDNLQFDQNAIYNIWHDPARGTIPVATALAPALQEINTPLLDWYYSKLTENDELMSGVAGIQYIWVTNFNDRLFPAWCALTRDWCAGAGFHSAGLWCANIPSAKYSTYMKMCGLDGVMGEGWGLKTGFPPRVCTFGAANEQDLFQKFTNVAPNPEAPVFVNFTPIVGFIYQEGRAYSAVKRQIERVQQAYPGRYVFLLPKDQFATIRAYFSNTDVQQLSARPGNFEGLTTPVTNGDGEFTIVERNGARCWQVPKSHYLYLDVPDTFRPQPGKPLDIELEYFDAGSGEIFLEYDSTDILPTLGGAYKVHPSRVRRTNLSRWQLARFRVADAGFGGLQNGGADFRFYNGGDDLFIRAVRVRRVGQ
jgi:hypothetical protein